MLKHQIQTGPSRIAYVEVDYIAGATEKATSLGAKIVRDVTGVPGAGTMSIFIDLTGAMLSLWKPRTA